MHKVTPFVEPNDESVEWTEYRGVRMVAAHRGANYEYQWTREFASIFDRSDRGVVIVRGKDRASWLHNLSTNDIKRLKPGEGCYAYACDVRGRIQFDMNILCFDSELWLDIDLSTIPAALSHFNRFLISEDVQLDDATDRFARIGLAGATALETLRDIGAEKLATAPALNHIELTERPWKGHAFLSNFAGLPGFELV